jgi:hypothetical protein
LVYSSAKEAAAAANIGYGSMLDYCNRKRYCPIGNWCFFDDYNENWQPVAKEPNKQCKKIKCVETDEIYESGAAAAKVFRVTKESINRAARNGTKCAGYHWIRI